MSNNNNKWIALIVSALFFSSCVRSNYYVYPIQEIGASLVLEVNSSSVQRLFLCNRSDSVIFDCVEDLATQVLVLKNYIGGTSISILSSAIEDMFCIVKSNESTGLHIIPHNCFVLTETKESTFPPPYDVTLSLPILEKNTLTYRSREKGFAAICCQSEDSAKFTKSIFDRGKISSPMYLQNLPSFFTDYFEHNEPRQIKVTPLSEGLGFEYNGARVECDIPPGTWNQLCFFIDPTLPNILFNHSIYNTEQRGSFCVSDQNLTIIETDMVLGCPGISINVSNNRGVNIINQILSE